MPRSVNKTDKLALAKSTAQSNITDNTESLKDNHSGTLREIVDALEDAEQKRKEAVDNLSDRLVAIQDPTLFMSDVLSEAKRKLEEKDLGTDEGKETVSSLQTLAAVYSVVSEWEPANALPMATSLPM